LCDSWGHHSAGFTLDTYGHLMDALPKRRVEWIDELVVPAGFATVLKLYLDGALSDAAGSNPVQSSDGPKPLEIATERNIVLSGATECMAEGGRFELPYAARPAEIGRV
jgi:hypothetical protein